MSNQRMTPALHIARKHQSAPKAHWADGEIAKAAEEISAGRYVPDTMDRDALDLLGGGLALRAGTGDIAKGLKPTLDDFQITRDLNELGKHPRVVEAMERMRREVEEATDSQEAMEKAWMLHEMNEQQAAAQRWEGQERWEGKENEEMRQGRILTPQAFHERLCEVIGRQRVLLSSHCVKTHPEARSGRVGLYVANPEYCGDPIVNDYPQQRAQELRAQGEFELRRAKQLRLAGHTVLADRAFDVAGELAKAASEILLETSAAESAAPKPFVRVGTLQWPCGTEWMMMNFDEYGVPTTAKFLGWRTALLTLVRQRAITEAEAHEAFPVNLGGAADWYRQQLFLMRNTGVAVN